MAHGRKKAPAGYRWKTVTVPGSRPKSFTTKHVLVPIEGAEKEVVEAPALDMFNVPAPITQAYGKHPGQAVDPNVDRTPLRRTPINLMGVEDWSGKGAERDEAGMEMWYQDRAREALRDKEGTSIAPESEVRSIAGLANTQQEWDAQQAARYQRLPPPLQHAINRGDREALFAGMDLKMQQRGLDPKTAVGPMAGPVSKIASKLANATKNAVITSGAKKTVDKATTELGKRIRGEVQGTTTATGRSTVPLRDRIQLEAAKTQARKEGFPPMTATEVHPPRTSRLGGQNVLKTSPEVSRLLKEGPTPGRTTTTPPISQDFQRTNLYNTGLSLKDRIAAQVQKGATVTPRRSLVNPSRARSPLAERIRADRTLTAASDAARTQHPSIAAGNALKSRIAGDVVRSEAAAAPTLTLEQRIAAQVNAAKNARTSTPTLAERIRGDVATSRSTVPAKTLEERIRAEAARVAAARSVPPAAIPRDPSRLRPDIARNRSLAKTAGITAVTAGGLYGIDQFLKMERAEDQTQAAIDAAVQTREDIVEDTESGIPGAGTMGEGGVSQDIGNLPEVVKGPDAVEIAANPNLAKIWGKYAYDPKARAKKFNEGMNSIWKKMALLNAIAVMTGNKSMAPAYMEMAMAKLDRMDKFEEEGRVSSIWKEVFTGPNGEFYMPKNKTEAAERAAKAGGSPTTIKDIFGAVPTKPTPKAATGYVTWTDGKKNIPLQKGELGPTGYWVGKAGSEGGGQYERAASKAREHIMLGGEGAQQKAVAELVQYYNSTKDTTGALIFGTDMAEKMATEQLQKILITMGRAEGEPSPSLGDSGVSDKTYSREEADQMIRRANPMGDTPRDEYEKSIEDELKRLGY